MGYDRDYYCDDYCYYDCDYYCDHDCYDYRYDY
jgi:hypothetical protein